MVYVSNLLIESASSVEEAQRVFDAIPSPNLYSWNLLLAAYALNGRLRDARRVFARMPHPNVVSWNVMLSACSQRSRTAEAWQLFHWMPMRDTVSWNIIQLCGNARQVFDAMPQRSILSWNTLVSSYASQRHLRDARLAFNLMPSRNSVSLHAMIKAYNSTGAFEAAALLFAAMPRRNVVSWNSMLAATRCWQQHQLLWSRMPQWDVVSCNARIHACLSRAAAFNHGVATFWAMPTRDSVSWNALAAGYASSKCGKQQHARRILELMPQWDLVSANCWLHYCCQTPELAKLRFDAMPHRDGASWNSMLCRYSGSGASLAAAEELFWHKMPAWDVIACTAMVAAYGRSQGSVNKAALVFATTMVHKDVVAWTAIMSAYASHGEGMHAVAQSWSMALDGLQPNDVTYTVLLHACAQAGLLEQGVASLAAAGAANTSNEKHYSCCVDMLGRAKQLAAAEELIALMPVPPSSVTWTAVLAACRFHGDVQRACNAAMHLIRLCPASAFPYVLLLSIFYEVGLVEEAMALRRLMDRKHVTKIQPGSATLLSL